MLPATSRQEMPQVLEADEQPPRIPRHADFSNPQSRRMPAASGTSNGFESGVSRRQMASSGADRASKPCDDSRGPGSGRTTEVDPAEGQQPAAGHERIDPAASVRGVVNGGRGWQNERNSLGVPPTYPPAREVPPDARTETQPTHVRDELGRHPGRRGDDAHRPREECVCRGERHAPRRARRRGGRGTGAAEQALSADKNTKLVAVADAFQDRLESSLETLKKSPVGDRVDVPSDRRYVGFDAYKNVIDQVDVVLLTTPPHFRPIHLAYAVEKGIHAFVEKPVATDAPGVRAVLQQCEDAKKKNLSIVSGPLLALPRAPARDDEARPRRGDRRHRRGRDDVQLRRGLGPEAHPRAGRLGDGVPDAQLVLLRLAQRRPHRRAGGPRDRHDGLGPRRRAPHPAAGARAAARSAPTRSTATSTTTSRSSTSIPTTSAATTTAATGAGASSGSRITSSAARGRATSSAAG